MEENKVLAVVAGVEITQNDLEEVIMRYPEDKRGYFNNEQGKKQLLEQIIAFELFNKFGAENNIDKTEELPSDIVALSFNLYEPYGLEMVGSTWFDEKDEDWACDESFEPTQRSCPNFEISDKLKWEEVLEIVVAILKDLLNELADLNIFRVEHIAVGFVDGDLIIIK